MSQQPNYRFTLISNLDKVTNLGAVGVEWTNGAGAAWTNGSQRIQNVNAGASSAFLSRPVSIIAGKRYIVVINYTSLTACQIIISNAIGQDLYLVNAPAAPSSKILTCSFTGRATSVQQIGIRVANATPSINVSFTTILVSEVGTLTRVIEPGGWKSISKANERLFGVWGFSETLTGQIDIVGSDFEWLKSYLVPKPDKQFYCSVEIDNGGVYENYFTGLLDTTALSSVGIEHTYRGTFGFLKESEWSQFISRLDTPLDGASNKGINQEDVVDSRVGENILPPIGFEPRLTLKFSGSAAALSNNQLTANAFTFLGFGSIIRLNDGFETFVGVSSSQESIQIPQYYARIRSLVGTIKVTWSGPAQIAVEAPLTTAAPQPLTSGIVHNINLSEVVYQSGRMGWSVRIRNTSGSTQTFGIGEAVLEITNAQVEYTVAPRAKPPWIVMKSYTSRVLGEYDNLRAPIFEDATSNGNVLVNINTPFQSPPPRFKPYNNNSGLVGNYFIGAPNNWTRNTLAPFEWLGTGPSNVFLSRYFSAPYTTYVTLGTYQLFIGTIFSAGMVLEVVGLLDDEFTVLLTLTYPGAVPASITTTFNVDKYYEGIGLRLVSGNISFHDWTVTYPYPTGNNIVRGKYALNMLTNGYSLEQNSGTTDFGNTPYVFQTSSFINYKDVFIGLIKIFGLGIEPETISSGKTRIYMDDAVNFFLPGFGSYMYAEEFTVEMDNDLLSDHVTVGGPIRNESTIDQDSPAAKADYATTYSSTKRKKDLEFEICVNSALLLLGELSNEDLALFELSSKPLPGEVIGEISAARYRTSNGLTIVGSPSPRQPNWKHSEGRIIRRNNPTISSMGSRLLYLVGGVASTLVTVDASDGLGAIADADPIYAEPLFTPWLIKFETELTLQDEKQLIANRKLVQRVNIHGIERAFYLKSAMVNRSTGKGIIAGWLKASGDFSSDFSFDFEVTPLPVEI